MKQCEVDQKDLNKFGLSNIDEGLAIFTLKPIIIIFDGRWGLEKGR